MSANLAQNGNMPRIHKRKDKAGSNPRRNPTRVDAQQSYYAMKKDMWRQLVSGALVCVPEESLGLWREAHSLIAQGYIIVEARGECTLWIRFNFSKFKEIDRSHVKAGRVKKHHLHHSNHTDTDQV